MKHAPSSTTSPFSSGNLAATALPSWYVARTGNHQGLVIDETTGANVAVTYAAEDAPLVAAAPDLAAIARRWMEWATGPVVPIAVRMALQEDTRAAIARATGGREGGK